MTTNTSWEHQIDRNDQNQEEEDPRRRAVGWQETVRLHEIAEASGGEVPR